MARRVTLTQQDDESAEDGQVTTYILGSDDGHCPGLLLLLAEMHQREGTDPDTVASMRSTADAMAAEAQAAGRVVFTLDTLVTFATTLRTEEQNNVAAKAAQSSAVSSSEQMREGDIVCALSGGTPGKVHKVFGEDDDERVRGRINVLYPLSEAPVTVLASAIRRATPPEIEIYHKVGGR